MGLSTIPEAIEDVKAGKFVIIFDDDKENEGDLALAADKITAQAINFMIQNARGLVCLPIAGMRLDELRIPLMVRENSSSISAAFTVSIEAKHGITTGISAADRAQTIKTVIDPHTKPEDLVRPGHVFPLRATESGVLGRAGHTEAIVDLARLAGLYPAGVICEILNEDGDPARSPELEFISTVFEIKIISIADLITYRRVQLMHQLAEVV